MSPPPWPLVQSSSVLVFYCYCNEEPQTSGLNQHQCTILQFGGSEIWNGFHWVKNQCVHKAAFLGNDPFSCLLQLLMAPTSLACGLLPFKVNNSVMCFSPCITLTLTLHVLFAPLRIPVINQAQPDNPASLPIQCQLINNFNSACSLISPLLLK